MKFNDVGSPYAKRALEVAAVGQHTIEFFGAGPIEDFEELAWDIGAKIGAGDADITVEVTDFEWVTAGEPHERVMERIEGCVLNLYLPIDSGASMLLKVGINQLSLSPSQADVILDVALTIASLAGAESVGAAHMAEALQYYVPEEELR